MGMQRSRTTPERKADYSPVGQLEAKCSTVKQGILQKLASGAVAEGGWLSLGSSQLPRSTSDARMDSKHDMESWHPQQVKIELTQTTFTHNPRKRNVTAAIHFCAAGQLMGRSATGKIELESCSDIQYTDGGADFILVSGAREQPSSWARVVQNLNSLLLARGFLPFACRLERTVRSTCSLQCCRPLQKTWTRRHAQKRLRSASHG